MPSIWDKLDWKEKAWLMAVYGISLMLTALIAYNIGRGSPPMAPSETRDAAALTDSSAPTPKEPASDAELLPAPSSSTPVQQIDLSQPAGATIKVHVAGAVKQPGLYELPAGSRVQDALQKAGGAKADADTESLNLAEPLSDGQKVYVPHRGETQVAESGASVAARPPRVRSDASTPTARFPLDINRASAAELELLPGIGPVLAGRIVEYRKLRGRFQSVDELLDVPGIGPKRLEQIRPYVVVR